MRSPLEMAAERAALPFKLLEDLGVRSGYERSFKMRPGELLANRYLLGVPLASLTLPQVLGLCRALTMPEDYLATLTAHLDQANLIFLGFEDNEPGCIYKVYLEFWDRLKRKLQSRPPPAEPALLHLGFKWQIDDPAQRTISKYICHPLLSVQEIKGRVNATCASHPHSPLAAVVAEILARGARRAGEYAYIFLDVQEEAGPRRSFDINLYKAGLRLGEIYEPLSHMQQYYAIPTPMFERLFQLVGQKQLGHLSGGWSRTGTEFFTVYYEA